MALYQLLDNPPIATLEKHNPGDCFHFFEKHEDPRKVRVSLRREGYKDPTAFVFDTEVDAQVYFKLVSPDLTSYDEVSDNLSGDFEHLPESVQEECNLNRDCSQNQVCVNFEAFVAESHPYCFDLKEQP